MKKIILFSCILLSYLLSHAQDPTVYITNGGFGYSVIEGNSYDFTVSMYSAATTDVIVDVSTIANTADASDYVPINTTVTIPAGQLSSNVLSIPTTNDSTVELNEYFTIEATVTSSNTLNSEIIRSITLWDNDATPTVNFYDTPSIVEGQAFSYPVTLSNYFSSDVSIVFSTSSGTAGASDYNDTSTTVTIPAGQNSGNIIISTLDDTLTEADETYTISGNITTGNTTNANVTITVTIIDNDTPPTLLPFYEYTTYEGSGNNSSYVSVSLDREFNSDINIQFNTSNGTAGDTDFTSISQTKTISAGDRNTYFIIPITDDVLDEPEETINITATVISGNTANTMVTGTVTIIDNDGLPDFKLSSYFNDNSPTGSIDSLAAEEGYPIKFYLALTHPSPIDTDISITTTNGTADNSDYTTSTITTTIPAGQYHSSYDDLFYSTILDELDEDDENFFITAQVTSGNTYNSSVTEEAFILDNYAINAQPDDIISILEVGTTFQVLDNDTFEGLPVNASDLNITLLGNNTIGATLSPTGILTVPANIPIGYYNIQYEICESANPTSCDTAYLIIRVESPLEASYTATYVDFNGDGFTSAGDTVEFEFSITNNGNQTITDIDADVSFQNIDIVGGPLASLAPGITDDTTFTALHAITQEDINFGYYGGDLEGAYFFGTYYGNEVIDYLYDESQSYQLQQSDGLKLNAFVDSNANGIQESGEPNFQLGEFEYEVNNDGVIRHLYVSPHYLYESNPSTTYDLSYVVDSDYASAVTSSASYSNVTVPTGSEITTYDFPITATPYDDLSIDIAASWRPPIPGFHYWNYITFTNNSTEVVSSGTIDFTMDNAVNLDNVYNVSNWYGFNPAAYTTTATGFTYSFSNLQPFQTRHLWVKMYVPTLPTVSLGQLVNNSVDIEVLPGDIVPSNNSSSLTQTIVGSYDPNDITERHGPEIVHSEFTTDDYLTYTIRFENTGTANAINVRIEDLLDEQLDESTLKMVDASHAYTLERIGKQLEWNFFGIDLPPSEDDNSLIGHGFLTFKIKPFPDYAIGDIIPNTAEIYFDFNPAIITNTWLTEFVEEELSVTDFTFEGLKIYPIPTKNNLVIENNTIIDNITVTSILGQQILYKDIKNTTAHIGLSNITNGVYFVTLSSNKTEKTVKVVKE
ncbi:DUF7619 domain-containing protein [Psychroserpens sp. S379A]|uniref:DUF7619 domain-containing protein n=1 Tax=Psychroserpens sp. S379A TaxID=3415137 RepID=UPI003C7A193A